MARRRELDRIYRKEAGDRTFVEVAGALSREFLTEAVEISNLVATQQAILEGTLRNLPTQLAKAGHTLDAIDLAEALKHEGRVAEPEYLREVAIARAKAGDVAGALRTARTMPDMSSRVGAMVGSFFRGNISSWDEDGVAQLQAKAGDRAGAEATVREALDLLAKAGDPVRVAYALTSIARVQAAIGDLPAAIRTAESIGDPVAKDWARVGIAVALAREGHREAALAQADGIKDVAARTATLIQFALARGRANDPGGAREYFDRAIEAARRLDATEQAYAMRHIAWRQAEAGDTDGAFRTHDRFFKTLFNPNSIPGTRVDYRALEGIATMQARSGDAERARRTLERLKAGLDYDYDASENLGKTAEYQVASGEGEAALRWAQAIDSPRAKARALIGIARGWRSGAQER
jgi:tetratricopeptide (TPR) repeat protein